MKAAPNLYLGAPTIRLFVKLANALNQRANHSGSIVVCKRKSQREALRERCNLKWKNEVKNKIRTNADWRSLAFG
jgi:hypothetical protein